MSNIVMRMKTQPRTRKASAVRASPYTNPLHGRKGRKGRQNKSVTVRVRNSSKDTAEVVGCDSQQAAQYHIENAAVDQIEQAVGCVQPIEVIQGGLQ